MCATASSLLRWLVPSVLRWLRHFFISRFPKQAATSKCCQLSDRTIDHPTDLHVFATVGQHRCGICVFAFMCVRTYVRVHTFVDERMHACLTRETLFMTFQALLSFNRMQCLGFAFRLTQTTDFSSAELANAERRPRPLRIANFWNQIVRFHGRCNFCAIGTMRGSQSPVHKSQFTDRRSQIRGHPKDKCLQLTSERQIWSDQILHIQC